MEIARGQLFICYKTQSHVQNANYGELVRKLNGDVYERQRSDFGIIYYENTHTMLVGIGHSITPIGRTKPFR